MTDQSTTHSSLRRINKGFHEFWTKPASTKPLAVLRILVATVLLFQAYSWLGSVQALFGRNAIISWDALQSLGAFPLATQGPFHLSYVSELLGPWGMSADDCVMGTYALYVAALVGLLLGYQSRCSAILAFVMHLYLTDSAPATTNPCSPPPCSPAWGSPCTSFGLQPAPTSLGIVTQQRAAPIR